MLRIARELSMLVGRVNLARDAKPDVTARFPVDCAEDGR